MIKNFKWLLLVSLAFVACNNDDEDTTPAEVPITPGSAVFTKYVALGDSFAAGYSDGALFAKGQQGSYANILSQQFALAGGGAFTTPLMLDNIGGFSSGGTQVAGFPTRLVFNPLTSSPVNVPGVSGTSITAHLTGSFGNLGIPGAKSFHLMAAGYGNVAGVPSGAANPYFARIASSATTTILADAVAQKPTFFSLFIGGNDVLGYATSGGIGKNQTGNPNPATYGSNDITDPTVFANVYTALITGLTAGGAKGVVANLPYVNALPYFTTVPYNPAALTAPLAAQLNSGYAVYNGGLQQMVTNKLLSEAEAARRTIKFAAGNNAVVIVDSYLTDLSAYGLPSYRQATKEDFLVLISRTFIGTTVGGDPTKVNGLSVPLADNWVLSKDEVKEVSTATDAYNVTIEAIAKEKGLAFVNTRTVMAQLSNGGVNFGGFNMTSAYVTGGAFSLDGVHPSARGYGLIANIFIDAINVKYGSTLRHVDLGIYPIQYPANL
ncbi:SGNH/GDSL hydrolase family protein [Flavobacterium sp. LS1R47]|uniref:SGNH/GDSL hydrolase family protein n=1 Tax=Flavobacterium frigoritolerans TaxID=2987686 RepID=A0A9X3C7P7_9FLAO|nr:SGNH/GDSL hydrolase family protein [Flavobacterium frigoritolerans]MCV9931962.1 SGNH/GDSL hydrolase family protein [Flavobacterium frigoritolerans]